MLSRLCFLNQLFILFSDKPIHGNETIKVLSVTDDGIQISWKKPKLISVDISHFYGYLIVIKESTETNYTRILRRRHNSSDDVFIVDLTNLKFNTTYNIEVRLYREVNGERDFGDSYQNIRVKTACKGQLVGIFLNELTLSI